MVCPLRVTRSPQTTGRLGGSGGLLPDASDILPALGGPGPGVLFVETAPASHVTPGAPRDSRSIILTYTFR